MTPITREGLSTNYTAWADCAFTGSATGTVLTVTSVQFGTIENGATLFPPFGSPTGLTIAYAGGTGGAGTYTLSSAATIGTSVMACGNVVLTQAVKIGMQCDVHAPQTGNSSDMAETISTLFRSEIATDAFDLSSGGSVWPLYADDPIQRSWQNAEQQYESINTVMAYIQGNQAIPWPTQFSATAVVTIIPADGAP